MLSLAKSGSSAQNSSGGMGRWGVPFSATGAKWAVHVESKAGRGGPQSHSTHQQSCRVHFCVSPLGFTMEFSQQWGESF